MFFTLEKKEVLVRKFSFGVFSLQKGEQLFSEGSFAAIFQAGTPPAE